MSRFFYIDYELANHEVWIDLNEIAATRIQKMLGEERDMIHITFILKSGHELEGDLSEEGLEDLRDLLFKSKREKKLEE